MSLYQNLKNIFSQDLDQINCVFYLSLAGSTLLIILILLEIYEGISIGRNKYKGRGDYNFSYDHDDVVLGPLAWRKWYFYAGENSQSPINLSTRDPIVINYYPPLSWSYGYMEIPITTILFNEGHTVILENVYDGIGPVIAGGPLDDQFNLIAIKFKWGANDSEGTEHAIDYVRYAMELQAVHVKSKYNRIRRPDVYDSDAVLILSYLYEISEFDNPYFEIILENLPSIRYPNTFIKTSPFPVSWLIPKFVGNFFTYYGSLTIPPCTEGVRWIIQAETLGISYKQVKQFRKLRSNSGTMILNNCRPLQQTNKRDVLLYLRNIEND